MVPITAINVNEAFLIGINMLHERGQLQTSQHGDTLEMPHPVSVCYLNPRERILFDKDRASNPFLNLFEALWLIAGRNDVKTLSRVVGNMAKYSDDGETYYGAYGWRLRYEPTESVAAQPCDQIEEAIRRLKAKPDDRQVVLTIRRPDDMFYYGKDQPCNMQAALKIRGGMLNMHVFNRSNDFIWGMTGTNVVQFSMLQEYIAGRLGVGVGTYHQTTDSMHVYVNDQWERLKHKRPHAFNDLYGSGTVKPFDMMQGCEDGGWDADLKLFFARLDNNLAIYATEFKTSFFGNVVAPIWNAFTCYEAYRSSKEPQNLNDAIEAVKFAADCDWKYAAKQWLEVIRSKA